MVANAHIWGRKKVSGSDRSCVCSDTRFREAVKPAAFGGTLSREVFVCLCLAPVLMTRLNLEVKAP